MLVITIRGLDPRLSMGVLRNGGEAGELDTCNEWHGAPDVTLE